MENHGLDYISVALCLVLGSGAAFSLVAFPLDERVSLLAWLISLACLPLSILSLYLLLDGSLSVKRTIGR